MEVVTCIAMVLIAGLAAWLIGMLCVEIGADGGPRSVSRSGLVGSLFVALIALVTGTLMKGMPVGFILAGFSWASASWSVRFYTDNLDIAIAYQVGMAPAVRDYFAARFGSLDADGDQLIKREDLDRARADKNVDIHDETMLEQATSHLSEVGHVIGVRQEPTAVISATGGMPIIIDVPVHGISREDLETYPQRLREKYQNWLPLCGRQGS